VYAKEFISVRNPGFAVTKVISHIALCRTPALGAAVYSCACGKKSFVFHSCRDRHCPTCQNAENKMWADRQLASSLPVKYFHLVFTVPESLNETMLAFKNESFGSLFEASSKAVLKLSSDKKYLGATPGFTSVLHTWGQTMQFHPHVHVILTAAGLADGKMRFVDRSDRKYLFPVRVLSRIFRGIFIESLSAKISLCPGLKSALYNTEFSCHIEEVTGNIGNPIKYLARYANKICISDKRIVSHDRTARTVTFSYKDNKDSGKQKQMTLDALEFMRRFLMHVLPRHFMKIRHYGIFANFDKSERISRCLRLLGKLRPASPPLLKQGVRCPVCGNTMSTPIHIGANVIHEYIRLLC
jgi:hypothetical protein